ncbi:MAG: endonuclease/exonuclease/phosphatase family protein [Campylobacterales bacterium]|nr:endonuclease/exonuclease/phosphatase family protein [Campylobacterales bacterium]
MRALWLLWLLGITVWGEQVRVATYNVENLFDLKRDGNEYTEYIPNTSWKWNTQTYRAKIDNITRVIAELNADIVALQEIESREALRELQKSLGRSGVYYPYMAIADGKNSTVKVALLSRFPFDYTKELRVTQSLKYRNILEAKFTIGDDALYLFVNHWKAKSGPESERIVSARVLKKRLYELGHDKAIVLLGDFNSHYEEHQLFIKNAKHNNTRGITGINHTLKSYKGKPVQKEDLLTCKDCLYNLWYELDPKERWSHVFKSSKEALDNILISAGLWNHQGLEFMRFTKFNPNYLFDNKGKPFRWSYSRGHPKFHLGKGYSDHLPLYADFTIK